MKNPFIVLQQGQSDCGVACLLSIIRFYGGNNSLEYLRHLSGTTIQGTSMLGIKQSAQKVGLDAEAFEVNNIAIFKNEAIFPCILHLLMDGNLEHYIVCFEVPSPKSNFYIIGNPATGLEKWTEEKLLSHWKSRAILILEPNKDFKTSQQSGFSKLNWLKEYLKKDVSLLLLASFLGIIVAVLGLSTAIFSQSLLDHILPMRQFQKLYWALPLFTLICLAKTGLSYFRSGFMIKHGHAFNVMVMEDFYGKLLQLPNHFFTSRKIGEILTRLNDTRKIQEVISFIFSNIVIDILIIIISSIFIFYYSIDIGLILLVSIPIYFGLMSIFNSNIIRCQKEVLSSYATSESHFIDAISGIQDLKAVNRENFFLSIGKTFYQNFQLKVFDLGTLVNRFVFWSELVNSLFISLILGFCTYLVFKNQLLLGEMMAIIAIGTNFISAVFRLVNCNIRLEEAKIALERMQEFTTLKIEDYNVQNSNQLEQIEILKICNLGFAFPGKSSLLTQINFETKRGELTLIMGKIGSGKSILFQILQKNYSYQVGSIYIDNVDLSTIDIKVWRNNIGIVAQEVKIFNTTLLENIILGDESNDREALLDFCNKWGFNRYFDELPNSLFTIVGENGFQLSGGQKQIVGLVRALYREPKILLLDETTSNMDEATEKFVFEFLMKIKHKMIILMVTHRNIGMNYADKVLELKDKTIYTIK